MNTSSTYSKLCGVHIDINCNGASVGTLQSVSADAIHVVIEDSEIIATKNDSNLYWNDIGGLSVQHHHPVASLEIRDSKLEQVGSSALSDSEPPLINGSPQNLIIENSTLSALNYAVDCPASCYINNSSLKGQNRGALYATATVLHIDDDSFYTIRSMVSNREFATIKDSTIGVSSTAGYNYSCFIDYDSTIYFDGCVFVTSTGALGKPALRWGVHRLRLRLISVTAKWVESE